MTNPSRESAVSIHSGRVELEGALLLPVEAKGTKSGLLVGIVTLDDVMANLVGQLDELVGAMASEMAVEVRERPSR